MNTYIQGLHIKTKYLKAGNNLFEMQPNNFELLKETDEFINFLAFSTASARLFSGYYKNDILKATTDLLANIEKEIAMLEN
jgi:hypothetical protein